MRKGSQDTADHSLEGEARNYWLHPLGDSQRHHRDARGTADAAALDSLRTNESERRVVTKVETEWDPALASHPQAPPIYHRPDREIMQTKDHTVDYNAV